MMCVEISVCLYAAEGSPRPPAWRSCASWSGSGGWFEPWSAAVGGDGGIPDPAGGDHGVQVAQDRRGDDGLGLGGPQLVVLPAGQVPVAGGIDGVGSLCSPDRAPG